jgi:LPXTG-motif cell wall-anchored protein
MIDSNQFMRQVQIQDAAQSPVAIAAYVTLSIDQATAPGVKMDGNSENGAYVVMAKDAQVTFFGSTMQTAGRFYLQASSTSILGTQLTSLSAEFTVLPAEPVKLAFATSPSRFSFAYRKFAVQPVVEIQDRFSNLVQYAGNTVLLTVMSTAETSGGFPKLVGGATSFAAIGGTVAFRNLAVDLASADAYRLIASADGLDSARSEIFQVYAVTGGAAQLIFMTEPPQLVQIDQIFVPMPVVMIADASAQRVYNATVHITLGLEQVSSGGSRGAQIRARNGVLTKETEDGMASFEGVSVDTIGLGFRLLASSDGLMPALSRPFRVSAAVVYGGRTITAVFAPDESAHTSSVLVGLLVIGLVLVVGGLVYLYWKRKKDIERRAEMHRVKKGRVAPTLQMENGSQMADPHDSHAIQLYP